MKPHDIKTALSLCCNDICAKCPYSDVGPHCVEKLHEDARDLITRLQLIHLSDKKGELYGRQITRH